MSQAMAQPVRVLANAGEAQRRVLTPEALDFVAMLHRKFNATRETLLRARIARQEVIAGGANPDFLAETRSVREGAWQVAPAPADLNDRRVEITGPVERKMMINALNSGAKVLWPTSRTRFPRHGKTSSAARPTAWTPSAGRSRSRAPRESATR
ncbi:MAG TPA: hypothetical protein VFN39_09170 [Gemmatimonadaceae bacterium]|nr:hypothetical protein [Gemmatimonadaceae bacterium]